MYLVANYKEAYVIIRSHYQINWPSSCYYWFWTYIVLTAVGISFLGVHLSPLWLEVVVGVVMLGAGIYIVRGGSVGL